MGRPLDDISGMQLMQVWNGVVARTVHGERLSLAVVELEPNCVVPEHSHDNEQLGLVITGTVSFRVGTETAELGPGGTWRIPSNTPHEVHAGPEGAVVIDVFAPVRADWDELETLEPRAPMWP
jgi:quercetin dioxygenase-like cupin family protein